MTTTSTTKVLRIAVPMLAGLSIAAAVLARVRAERAITIPGGTTLVAELEHRISTDQSRPGDDVSLRTVAPLHMSDGVSIPDGIVIQGTITEVKNGGRVAGAPVLGLRFDSLRVDGESHAIAAEPFRVKGRSDAPESALEIGGGAVAGGVLGRVFGGRGGTVKGAVAGAAIGSGVAVATKGDRLVLPAGQRLRIRLTRAVIVAYTPRS